MQLNGSGLLDEEKMVVDDGGGNLVTTAFDLKHNLKKSQPLPLRRLTNKQKQQIHKSIKQTDKKETNKQT